MQSLLIALVTVLASAAQAIASLAGKDEIDMYEVATPGKRNLPTEAISLERRLLLMAPTLCAFAALAAEARPVNPHETFILQPNQIQFKAWQGLPPGSGEMAMLCGDLDRLGPYLVLMMV
jgi:hypothetical protein